MTGPVPPPRIWTERLLISLPGPDDIDELLAYGRRNLGHLAPWFPPPPPDGLTVVAYRALTETIAREFEAGRAVSFWLRLREARPGPFVGAVTLSNIVLGALRGCTLSYHVDQAYEGRGYMTEAVSAVIRYAFESRRLHRIMAPHAPENERSARLLRRLGFVAEGLAKEYLFIQGRWRDHVLTSLINQELTNV